MNEKSPRLLWVLAVIEETFRGRDDHVCLVSRESQTEGKHEKLCNTKGAMPLAMPVVQMNTF